MIGPTYSSPKHDYIAVMNFYETESSTDKYASDLLYGRYLPQNADFRPDPQFIGSTSPPALKYCTPETMVAPGIDGLRDVFAIGSIIVKSGHLQDPPSEHESP